MNKYFDRKLMKPLVALCFSACLIVLQANVSYAQKKLSKASDDKKLSGLFSTLKQADGYTYQIKLQSSIAGDTQKTPVQTTLNYSSPSQFVMYSHSENELVFLCSKGQFKVDGVRKEVYYKLFENDSLLAEAKGYYLKQMGGSFDSVFLNDASISQKKQTKKTISYRLTYPKESSIKEFKIMVRQSDKIPERIEYIVERPANDALHSFKIRQTLVMDHYIKQVPEEVVEILAEENMLAFLQKKYSSYSFRKI